MIRSRCTIPPMLSTQASRRPCRMTPQAQVPPHLSHVELLPISSQFHTLRVIRYARIYQILIILLVIDLK